MNDKGQTDCADASSPSSVHPPHSGFARRRNLAVSSRIQSQACCAALRKCQRAGKVIRRDACAVPVLTPPVWKPSKSNGFQDVKTIGVRIYRALLALLPVIAGLDRRTGRTSKC
jgi:hypothetical protein